jgi:hypothetical protein
MPHSSARNTRSHLEHLHCGHCQEQQGSIASDQHCCEQYAYHRQLSVHHLAAQLIVSIFYISSCLNKSRNAEVTTKQQQHQHTAAAAHGSSSSSSVARLPFTPQCQMDNILFLLQLFF